MKKKLFILIMVLSIFMPCICVKAETIEISSPDELESYLGAGGMLKLTSNITMASSININNDVVLDLNGYKLDLSNEAINSFANFTIKDTSSNKTGSITSTANFAIIIGDNDNDGKLVLDSGNIDCKGKYCLRNKSKGKIIVNGGNVNGKSFVIYNEGSLKINDGTINISSGTGIRCNTNATFEMNGGLIKQNSDYDAVILSQPGANFTMNNGKIEATYTSGRYSGAGVGLYKDTEFIMNGGEITAYSFAVFGNGSLSGNNASTNAKITINDGTLTSTGAIAMYIPQVNGDTLIAGGTIQGEKGGIEIRAGKLTVTGGTVISNADHYESTANNNGANATGTAISVVQHTTKQPIEVNILGGEFNAYIPLVESNAMNNSAEDIAKVKINISDGKFNSSSDETIKVEDYSEPFITGGTYTNNVTDYVAEKYGEKKNDNSYIVLPHNSVSVEDEATPITDLSKYFQGDEVVLKNIDKEGYIINDIIVTDESGNRIDVSDNKFVMPKTDVFIKIVYNYIYKIISGADQTYNKKDIIIKTNGELSKLDKIKVDGTTLDTSNYELASGSTVLTLKSSYLNTLTAGNHTVEFVYNDGTVSTTLNITQKNNSNNPQTGDNILLYVSILGLSIIGLVGVGLYVKKEK